MRDQAADLNSQSAIGATHAPFSRPQFMAGVMSALRSTELWLGLQLHDTCHPLPSRWPPPEGTAMSELTVERARELLSYDPETGLLTWRCRRGRIHQGDAAGFLTPYGYVDISVDERKHKAHRIAWLLTHGVWPTLDIDHINGNRADNRLVNLREVTRSTNQQNQRASHADSRLGVIGAYWIESKKKYRSTIYVSGKQTHLGYFLSPEQARDAYVTAKRKLHEGNTL